jgi:lipoyl(octanoyl) transferase
VKGFAWCALGLVDYETALRIQERVAAERAREERPDTLLLLEHPPTITLGRRAVGADVLWSPHDLAQRGICISSVRRGGRATYHGPGQLVGYPITRLPRGGRGVRRFVRGIEAALIRAAADLGVRAACRTGHPGVWVGERKLASIGIEVRRGISRHGFALNVDMDLSPFQAIVPCGEPGLELTDLARAAGSTISLTAATAAVVRAWRSECETIEEESPDAQANR